MDADSRFCRNVPRPEPTFAVLARALIHAVASVLPTGRIGVISAAHQGPSRDWGDKDRSDTTDGDEVVPTCCKTHIHPRSVGRQQPNHSYRLRHYLPNLWTVPSRT